MKPITSVCCYKGYLYYYDEEETQEIKVEYEIEPGDEYCLSEVILNKVVYVKENGQDIPFDEKEVFDLIEKADLEEKERQEVIDYENEVKYDLYLDRRY